MAVPFFRHRGLIAFSAGGAMAEATVLSFLAPSARPLAPQVTALPPLAAYHDLRWLFAFNQSWLGFTAVMVALVVARAAVDAVLIQLAWPLQPDPAVPSLARPRFLTSVVSCIVLTVLVGLVLSPVVTLMFGVALLPFSWPYLAAVPILLGTAMALSQGGVGQAWWRRLPPARTAAWVIATFLILSLASALMTHLDTAGIVAVAGLAGVLDARAWYGLTAAAVRRSVEKPLHAWHWRATLQQIRRTLRGRTSWVPMAPLAAVMVLALVVGVTRLAFTGTVRFAPGTSEVAASADEAAGLIMSPGWDQGGGPSTTVTAAHPEGAVLVVEGFGSSCCHAADSLRAAEPGMIVRQFSYLGLNAAGQPIPYGPAAGDLSIQALGDRMAAQVDQLSQQAGVPVDVVAESEGTLGLYAMLARHPHVPVKSVTLLSPIVEPGQLGQAGGTVPGAALTTLNNLVGGMSPYGSKGAQELIDSVSEVGARYFEQVSHDQALPWLAVIPLADAVTLPACPWPRNVIFVDAFHGGLLGNASVRQLVEGFLTGGAAQVDTASQRQLRGTAELIAAAATAWRMPEVSASCPAAGG
ncbi:MAG TPA: hypothetical protein VJ371_20140 [Streptosporangiaceae bacterium]|nr:hypothetical protein [Streptosporangiaceae bacterium]